MKRLPLILAALVGVALVAGLLWMNQSDTGRSQRRSDTVQDDRRPEVGSDRLTESTRPGQDIADAATVAKLIEKYGGFETKGRLFLTRPTAEAVDLEVVFHSMIDGVRVESRAKSGSDGTFSLAQLPRGNDYTMQVDAERVQPYSETIPEPDGSALDVGDIYLDRFYFLTGKIVSSAGLAVGQAEVAVILPNGGGGFSWRSSAVNASAADPVAAESASGADGRFMIKLRDPGIFTVRVRAKDWAPHYRGDVFIGAGGDTDVRVSLTRGTEVSGIVLASDGRPVVGATVSLFANGRQWWSQVKELRKTEADGRFDFRIEPQSDRYSVRVMPPKGVDINKSFRLPLTEELVVQLPGGATIQGRVVDATTEQPISGAEVLVGVQGPGGRGWVPEYQKVLTTDAFGSYRLEGVGTRNIQSLAVSAPGYAHFTGSQWTQNSKAWQKMTAIKLDSAQEIQLPDVSLALGRVIEGTVRDAGTGEPIAGATVTVNDWVVGNREYETSSDGRYRIEDVGERVSLRANADGYADIGDNPWRGADLPADQKIVQRDFELEPAGTVKGKVITQTGDPVSRALVRLRSGDSGRGSWMGDMRLRDYYTHTRSDGTYEIRGVPPVKLKAEVSAPGFDRVETGVKTLTSGGLLDGMDAKLEAAASIGGMVVARGGGLVPSARITIAKDPGDAADAGARWRMFAGAMVAFTDEKGSFYAAEVPVGDIVMRIEADGLATHEIRRKGVLPGEQITGMKITVKPALMISGKVVDEDGKPIQQAWVSARQTASPDGEPSNQQMGARIGGDGAFVMRNLPEGTYTIQVRTWSRGGGPQYEALERTAIVAGTENLVLTLIKREE